MFAVFSWIAPCPRLSEWKIGRFEFSRYYCPWQQGVIMLTAHGDAPLIRRIGQICYFTASAWNLPYFWFQIFKKWNRMSPVLLICMKIHSRFIHYLVMHDLSRQLSVKEWSRYFPTMLLYKAIYTHYLFYVSPWKSTTLFPTL